MVMRLIRRIAPLTLVLACGLASAFGVGGAAAASPGGEAVVGEAVAAGAPYRVDLGSRDEFVAQTNFVQCVGASMQMMLNMIHGTSDRTAATQLSLENLARRLSPRRQDGIQRQGASVVGWAAGLTSAGSGAYRLAGLDSIGEAVQAAAEAIVETGRPVGLLMWHGRHAWVMSGFEATALAGRARGFSVTRAIVMDPLYPYGSSLWGSSPTPGQALTIAALGRQFVPRGQWHGDRAAPSSGGGKPEPASSTASGGPAGGSLSGLTGKYVLVLPFDPAPVRGLRIS